MNAWITIIVVQILSAIRVGNGYSYEINNWRPLSSSTYRESPVDVIVDVVNDLGMKMLDCYMERPGNIAFSPAGLAFVLAALYEGSAGRGNRQIGHILGLPRDRRITRIGLRDIHRRLRSYLDADSFLGGLTLNRDDITLRKEYEDVLRFYGFDIANVTNRNDTIVMGNSTDTTTTSSNLEITTIANNDDPMATTQPTAPTMSAPIIASAVSDEETTDSTPTPDSTNNPLAELVLMANTTDIASLIEKVMDSTSSSTIILNSTTEAVEITTLAEQNTTGNASSLNSTTGGISDMNNATDDKQPGLIATTNGDNSSDDVQTIIPTIASVTTVNPGNQDNIVSVQSREDNNVRKRRSIKQRRSFPIYQEKTAWIDDFDDWEDYPSTFGDDIHETPSQAMSYLDFLVNGCDVSTISSTTHTAILPFAYFPGLRALALEFPLDDPRYNVIVFIPMEGINSKTLNRLLATKTLRQLRESLKPTWVRVTIPSFSLRGFITLTPYLQRLGIKDTFEPRTADLSPMSPDLGVYARDVQQSIGVNIRNFMKDMNDSMPTMPTTGNPYPSSGNVLHTTRMPIPFIADRPFLFFIVDNETSVALIAGRVDDPLNSRII